MNGKPVCDDNWGLTHDSSQVLTKWRELVEPFLLGLAGQGWNPCEMVDLLTGEVHVQYLIATLMEKQTKPQTEPQVIDETYSQSGPGGP